MCAGDQRNLLSPSCERTQLYIGPPQAEPLCRHHLHACRLLTPTAMIPVPTDATWI